MFYLNLELVFPAVSEIKPLYFRNIQPTLFLWLNFDYEPKENILIYIYNALFVENLNAVFSLFFQIFCHKWFEKENTMPLNYAN